MALYAALSEHIYRRDESRMVKDDREWER